jgi:hypothetical protein
MGRPKNYPDHCSVANCHRPYLASGLCGTHYARKRLGIPLDGPVRASPAEIEKYVTDVVLPFAGSDCLIWPFARYSNGWAIHKSRSASNVICEMVHGPPPPKHETAHSCGRGADGCINPCHLSWKTHLDNEQDKIGHGTVLRGYRQWANKLTESQVREIRAAKGRLDELADLYGVSITTIGDIKHRRTWKWL